MKKSIIFLLIAVTILIMSQGCQPKTNQPDKTSPYIGGTTGLQVAFEDNYPPTEVFDAGQFPFDIDVKLTNIGEADVNKGNLKVTITGLNPQDFGKTQDFFIKNGIDEDVLATYKDFEGNVIKPSPVDVIFPGLNFKDTLTGNFQTIIRADVCYSYKTEAVADGCIRKDVLSTDANAICQVNEKKTIYNSGAPIQVDTFQEVPSGTDKVRYLFTISHKGTGDVYAPGSVCPTGRTAKNKVHFKIESSVADLDCQGLIGGSGKEGDIMLSDSDGTQTIRCVQQTSSQLDFLDRIKITLTYDYDETKDQTILVKKSS